MFASKENCMQSSCTNLSLTASRAALSGWGRGFQQVLPGKPRIPWSSGLKPRKVLLQETTPNCVHAGMETNRCFLEISSPLGLNLESLTRPDGFLKSR